jgi:hypothetical protein
LHDVGRRAFPSAHGGLAPVRPRCP